jgi:hypothetical protein
MMSMVVAIVATFFVATMALVIATTIGHPLLNAKIKKMREEKEAPPFMIRIKLSSLLSCITYWH